MSCASWDTSCQAGSATAGAAAHGMESLYDSGNPLGVIGINALIVAGLVTYIRYTETSDEIMHWDKTPHVTTSWLVFFAIISLMMYIYSMTLNNPEEAASMKSSSFSLVFWSSTPIYAVIFIGIMFMCMAATSNNHGIRF